jgi:uncharacterized membrane protein
MSTVIFFLFVAALNVYALLLVFARSWLFRTPVYRPMVLNWWLSAVPILILVATFVGLRLSAPVDSRLLTLSVLVIGGVTWLVMLPNSSYLVTELNLNHRTEDDPAPLWYDIVAVLSLAMSGVVNTVFTILLAQLMYVALLDSDDARDAPEVWGLAAVVIVLVSVGMYLGRYVRLNSWDVRSPRRLITKITSHFREPGVVKTFLLFAATHSIFIGLIFGLIVPPVLEATGS